MTVKAWNLFLSTNFLRNKISQYLAALDRKNPANIAQVSAQIRQLIVSSQIPKDCLAQIYDSYDQMGSKLKETKVAVRTSLVEEKITSGKNRLFLNVSGDATIIACIKEIWSEQFSPMNLKLKLDPFKYPSAIIVQRMINADSSGFIHTVRKNSQAKGLYEIESIWGNGEYLVEKKVKPDIFVIDKKTGRIVEQKIEKQEFYLTQSGDDFKEKKVKKTNIDKPSLKEKNIKFLWEIARKIEKLHYYPQTIEWLCYHDQIYIVQTEELLETQNWKLETRNEQLDNPNLKERVFDLPIMVKGVGVSFGIVSGKVQFLESPNDRKLIDPGEIIALRTLDEEFYPLLKFAKGVIAQNGGLGSSSAMLARELQIPCILGASDLFDKLKNGDLITIDGKLGNIYKGKLDLGNDNKIFERKFDEYFASKNNWPTRLKPVKTASQILVNLPAGFFDRDLSSLNVDGVCSINGEFIYEEMGINPSKFLADGKKNKLVSELTERIAKICHLFEGQEVYYKFSDITSNSNLVKKQIFENDEANPLMGLRGVSRLLVEKSLLKAEIESVKKLRTWYKNLKIVIPCYRSIEELSEFMRILYGQDLKNIGSLKIWVSLSTPSNLILSPTLSSFRFDGYLIDFNNLTNLTLGVDGTNAEIANLFNQNDSSLTWLISHTASFLRKSSLPLIISGDVSGKYPYLVYQFIKAGVTGFAVPIDQVDTCRRFVNFGERKIVKK